MKTFDLSIDENEKKYYMHTITYEQKQRRLIDINIIRNQIKEEYYKSLKLRKSYREIKVG